MAGNPHPLGSEAWTKHNAAEVASRPTARLNRKPFTPDLFEGYRPKPVSPANFAGRTSKEDLSKVLGPDLTAVIWALHERIAELENAKQPVALAGVERR
jgi:hypothetical protein